MINTKKVLDRCLGKNEHRNPYVFKCDVCGKKTSQGYNDICEECRFKNKGKYHKGMIL